MKKIIWLLLFAVSHYWSAPLVDAQAPPPAPGGTVQPQQPPPPPPPPPPITEQGILFKETPFQRVVEELAAEAKIPIIIPETLAGSITINLPGVDAKSALRNVLDSKNYILVENKDGIFTVQAKAAEEPEVRAYTLNYTNVKDMTPAVKTMLTARGKVEVTGNTLIVSDVPSNLVKIQALIQELDATTRQVQIEARLYEMQRNPKKELGFDWTNMLSAASREQGLRVQFGSGDANVLENTVKQFVFNIGSGGREPVSTVLSARQFDVVLRFLNTDRDTELIATPRVVTADNKEATIKIVRQEPIPQFTFNTRTAAFEISGFDYKDIGNVLKVTPHVNKDGFITLDIEPEVSDSNVSRTFQGTPGGGAAGGDGGGGTGAATGGSGLTVEIPVINTRTVSTRVLMKNGDTLAIGGLIQTEKKNTYTKVPVVGDVPVLGLLFRSKNLETIKRNLLLFVTPTEIPLGGKTGFEDQAEGLKQGEVYVDDIWMPRDNAKPYKSMPVRQEDMPNK